MGARECPVCLEEFGRAVWCHLPCNHHVCFPCLLRMWEHSRRSCPLCRHEVGDCLPVLADDAASEETFERIVRRLHATHLMDAALRAPRPIAPRNARSSLAPPAEEEA